MTVQTMKYSVVEPKRGTKTRSGREKVMSEKEDDGFVPRTFLAQAFPHDMTSFRWTYILDCSISFYISAYIHPRLLYYLMYFLLHKPL